MSRPGLHRHLRSARAAALVALTLAGACRATADDDGAAPDGGPHGHDGGDTDAQTPPNAQDARIQDIQQGVIPADTAVTLRGVVVVAIDNYGARKGNFYVMEPEGGEYSGLLVYGAPLTQVADLVAGDIVDIEGGQAIEFKGPTTSPFPEGQSVTELQAPRGGALTVTVVGHGAVPEAHAIDVLAIGQMAPEQRDAEWEKWEGVLVKAEHAAVLTTVTQIGGQMPDPTFKHFRITGPLDIDSGMAAVPETLAIGDCLTSVTGMGEYFYQYKIVPVGATDVATGGAGCAAAEAAAACSDHIDNDANGFADCDDHACQGASAACTTATTVSAIQHEEVAGHVELSNLVVTAVSFNKSNLWVQDAATGAPYNGVFVYRGNASVPDVPADIVIGAHVNVAGDVAEEDDYTEIKNPTVTFVAGTPAQPMPVATTLAALTSASTAEPFEGVLVQLDNVKVFSADPTTHTFVIRQGTTEIVVDDTVYRHTATAMECYLHIVGIFDYNTFDNRFTLLPRAATDIVAGGTCN